MIPLAWHIGTTVPELALLVVVVFALGVVTGALGLGAYMTSRKESSRD